MHTFHDGSRENGGGTQGAHPRPVSTSGPKRCSKRGFNVTTEPLGFHRNRTQMLEERFPGSEGLDTLSGLQDANKLQCGDRWGWRPPNTAGPGDGRGPSPLHTAPSAHLSLVSPSTPLSRACRAFSKGPRGPFLSSSALTPVGSFNWTEPPKQVWGKVPHPRPA